MNPPDPYSTHLPALVWALSVTQGDVLELGAGWYSTPVLHALAGPERKVLTLEADYGWARDFLPFHSEHHRVMLAPSDYDGEWWAVPWAVALVDHGPGELRAPALDKLRAVGGMVVVHDTEPSAAHDYPGMAEQIASWPYRLHWSGMPCTTLLSLHPLPPQAEWLKL